MVEQDLIICRALVSIFSHPLLAESLVFRGGTAIHKLCLPPPARYSEDIDCVQIVPGPIGGIFNALRETLGPLLGASRRKQGPQVVNLIFRVESQGLPVVPLRLKVEINSREHFSELEVQKKAFSVESRWFSGTCAIPVFQLEELLGTKLRALYQRRKGRDLFDIWSGLTRGKADPELVVRCFKRYLASSGLQLQRRDLVNNIEGKMRNGSFIHDTDDLLRGGLAYSPFRAYRLLQNEIVRRLQ